MGWAWMGSHLHIISTWITPTEGIPASVHPSACLFLIPVPSSHVPSEFPPSPGQPSAHRHHAIRETTNATVARPPEGKGSWQRCLFQPVTTRMGTWACVCVSMHGLLCNGPPALVQSVAFQGLSSSDVGPSGSTSRRAPPFSHLRYWILSTRTYSGTEPMWPSMAVPGTWYKRLSSRRTRQTVGRVCGRVLSIVPPAVLPSMGRIATTASQRPRLALFASETRPPARPHARTSRARKSPPRYTVTTSSPAR